MATILLLVCLTALLPAVTLYNAKLRYPALLLIGCELCYKLLNHSAASTSEWVNPTILQDVYPVLIGYICSELIVKRRERKQSQANNKEA
jgi:hypothetical protein